MRSPNRKIIPISNITHIRHFSTHLPNKLFLFFFVLTIFLVQSKLLEFRHQNIHRPGGLFFLADLQTILRELWSKMYQLEGDKFDLERQIRMKDFEVTNRFEGKLNSNFLTTIKKNKF